MSNILSNIDEPCKLIVDRIVDAYNNYFEAIKEDCSHTYGDPGHPFDSLFGKDYLHGAHFTIDHKVNALMINQVFDKNDYSHLSQKQMIDAFHVDAVIQKTQVIEQLNFVKLLYENGLIFFTEDKDGQDIGEWKPDHRFMDEALKSGKHFNHAFVYSTTLLDFVSKFFYARVLPSQRLIDFKANGYKTSDEIAFKKTQRLGWAGVLVALLVGITSLVVSIAKDSTIDSIQHRELIEAIQQNASKPIIVPCLQSTAPNDTVNNSKLK